MLKEAELEGEGFTFHSLRHTFASAFCNKGEYPKVIQSLLGHSSITQTMDTYSHMMDDIGGDAVGSLEEVFDPSLGEAIIEAASPRGAQTLRVRHGD